ncbi:hypothetical protein L208DRAFT_829449 [Tricholoma matsutake]|nr:hypothetical protein L208DRAFT_829449 [Tricholoma matsutake 945]
MTFPGSWWTVFWPLLWLKTYFMNRSRGGVIIFLSAAIMLALATADVASTFRLTVNDLPPAMLFQFGNSLIKLLPHIRVKNYLFVTDKRVCPFELHQRRV